MRKAAFLEFNCINMSLKGTQDTMFCKFVNQFSLIHIENADSKVQLI
jgi:hypothetical protein